MQLLPRAVMEAAGLSLVAEAGGPTAGHPEARFGHLQCKASGATQGLMQQLLTCMTATQVS